jgi:ornithine--oxo-acid transaminase
LVAGLSLSFEAFGGIHPAMFGQMIMMRLFLRARHSDPNMPNNFMVLKAAPAKQQRRSLTQFVTALGQVMELCNRQNAFGTTLCNWPSVQ